MVVDQHILLVTRLHLCFLALDYTTHAVVLHIPLSPSQLLDVVRKLLSCVPILLNNILGALHMEQIYFFRTLKVEQQQAI
jgi:hypothetical protein